MYRFLLAVLVSLACPAALRADDYTVQDAAAFGRQWVRTHDYMLTAMSASYHQAHPTIPRLNLDDIADAGLTGIKSAWYPAGWDADSQGIPWHGTDFSDTLNTAAMNVLNAHFLQQDHLQGMSFRDEIYWGEIAGVAEIVAWVREKRAAGAAPADMVLYQSIVDAVSVNNSFSTANRDGTGALPAGFNFDMYVDHIVETMKPEGLIYHYHPFWDYASPRTPGNTPGVFTLGFYDGLNTYYHNMMETRRKAQEHGLLYFTWLQSFVENIDNLPASPWTRPPSESEMRFQAFTHLAAGYKGLAWFTYDDLNTPGNYGLVDADEQRTVIFDYVAAMTPALRRMGDVLRFAESTLVAYVTNQAFLPDPPRAPDGSDAIQAYTAGLGTPLIKNIMVQNASTPVAGQDALLSFFTADDGELYFMLTNVWHDEALGAADTELTYFIDFDPAVDSVLAVNPHTGRIEVLAMTINDGVDGSGQTIDRLVVTLPGGTGVLFKFNNGVAFLPEPSSAGLLGAACLALSVRRRPRHD